MANKFNSSFNKILLSRILILTVPGLILGQYIIYRQARSTLLNTARQNLKESADRKAEHIQQWTKSLESNLVSASQNHVLQSGQTKDFQSYVEQLYKMLSTQVSCVQLQDLQTEKSIANTCDIELTNPLLKNIWPQQQKQLIGDKSNIYVNYIIPEQLGSDSESNSQQVNRKRQVSLVWTVPVYVGEAGERRLRYALSIKSALPMQINKKRGSFTGSTFVINYPKGTILASPDPNKIGGNISEEPGAKRLKNIMRNAHKGRKHFAHIFSFKTTDIYGSSINRENDISKNPLIEIIDELKKILPGLLGLKLSAHNEFLAGYAAIPSPMDRDDDQAWIILAITPMDFALSGLREVQKVLIILILVLVFASTIASIYLARDLAHPLEKLRDYAITVNDLDSPNKVPQNLKIREFNQLAISLQKMVERLKKLG